MLPTRPPELDAETERKLAAGLYNEAWRLMQTESRTAEQTDAPVHTAHASRYHWGRVGTAVKAARGERARETWPPAPPCSIACRR